MAADIEKQVGVKPELIKSSGGVFEIVKDGQLVYSKKQTGRFPDHKEVIDKLK